RDALAEELSKEWTEKRGIEVVSVAINSATASPEDEALIKDMQRRGVYRNASMGAAALVDAQAEAMKKAAENPNGAMMGFMGMGMAQAAGGTSAAALYQAAAGNAAGAKANAGAAPASGGWKCVCGAADTGRVCTEGGKAKPEEGWKCSCGAVNLGKFCSECGGKRPSDAPLYRCDKCGFRPADPKNPPKFCPECGDPFTDEDAVR
ncbi:MAG: SPFH domain-containing protein, partial [Clostridia bacterium]|nr:SPFH domain-containing protein [Clostridia bacterium]